MEISLSRYFKNGVLKVVPGSHNEKLTNSEIQLITQNSNPIVCEVETCGIHIIKPLWLSCIKAIHDTQCLDDLGRFVMAPLDAQATRTVVGQGRPLPLALL